MIEQTVGYESASAFDVYETLLSDLKAEHPQHQGMSREEFDQALHNPEIRKTEISYEGIGAQIPQLAPVTAFDWLNDDFYEKTFPTEFKGKLLHFSDLPGVEPGEEVRLAIKDLANGSGILVFDAPSTDPEYGGRIRALLHALDVDVVSEQLLGTQTYFAGQVQLKREHSRRDRPMGMLDAYEELTAQGRYPQSIDEISQGALLVRSIDPERAELLRQLYDDAYVVLNDHPCKQGLSPDEFRDMLVSDTEVGKLIFVRNGEIETLCLLTTDLEKLSWVNPSYYRRSYPNRYANGQMVWFPGIATDPAKQGERNTSHLINLMAELAEYGDNEFVGLFDFCDMNTGWLNHVFEDMINEAPQTAIALNPIATQTYWALRLGSRQE